MKKRKKTRQEKIIADLHRKIQLQKQVNDLPSYQYDKTVKLTQTHIINTQILSDGKKLNPYLLPDLVKTLFVTGAILVLEIGLFFILKNRIFVLLNMSF